MTVTKRPVTVPDTAPDFVTRTSQGWQARTWLPLDGGSMFLRVSTFREANGGVASAALVVRRTKENEGYFKDFCGARKPFVRRLLQEHCRASEKLVREQHAEALERVREMGLINEAMAYLTASGASPGTRQ